MLPAAVVFNRLSTAALIYEEKISENDDSTYVPGQKCEWNDELSYQICSWIPQNGKDIRCQYLMINQVRLLFGEVLNWMILYSLLNPFLGRNYEIFIHRKKCGEKKKFDDKASVLSGWSLQDGWPVISDTVLTTTIQRRWHIISCERMFNRMFVY